MGGERALLGGNATLAAILSEAGCSHGALARRVNELASRQGVTTRYDKASVTRWLQGMHPRGRVPEFIAAALAEWLASGGPAERVYAMIAMFDEMDNRFGGGHVRSSVVHYLSTEVAGGR
ncbi:hypothetical protein AB0B89_21415 [Sphaerisporangium sp. NPDC049002]|uniref:hypothetical protein n=1 Tax=unclassified Sphaerisporangium TaxID=2630420 RepID=UPI0034067F64